MATTIVTPNAQTIGAYPQGIVEALATVAAAAAVDINALQAGTSQTNSSSTGHVRGVCYANQSLTAFVGVTGGTAQDGVTYVAGDRVLLANQTTAAQNGIYVVGTVDGVAHTAPLTRAADMAATAAILNGRVIQVSEGTLFAGSAWKAMCTGAKVVATDDPVFYPQNCRGTLTLASGTYTLGATEGLFLLSATRSSINATLNTAGGTVTSTVGLRAAVASRTIGKSGTAAAIILAIVAAGTVNAADNSTVDWLVTNW